MDPDHWTRNSESAWRRKIGMASTDDSRPPAERAVFIRRLKGLVEQRMLHFILDEHPDPQTKLERAPTWTPIPWICHNLEIAPSRLSSLLRELLGLSTLQLYDKLKLKQTLITLKYITLLKDYVLAQRPPEIDADQPDGLSTQHPALSTSVPSYAGNGSKHFWKWLKLQRKNPDFDRQALAKEFNFPSAARFHRAFNFATGSTPREFENLIIRLSIDNQNELARVIDRYIPKENSDEDLGIIRLHHEQLISPQPTVEVQLHPNGEPKYPLALYKKPEKPADPEIIDAVFTVLNHSNRPRRKRPLPPPQEEESESPPRTPNP